MQPVYLLPLISYLKLLDECFPELQVLRMDLCGCCVDDARFIFIFKFMMP